jgi:L-lactate dehydrogenase complex protein LldE
MKHVGLLATCLIDLVRPQIAFSAIKLIERAGYTVHVPTTQTCCGQPAYNSGDAAATKTLACKLLAEFESYDYLVIPSGSCATMVKVDYLELFADDPDLKPRFDALAAKTFELTDFLVNVAKLETLDSQFAGHITYHDSCNGNRYLGVKNQPRALLAKLPGVKLTEMAKCEQCCGFGGTFALKYGDISGAIVADKCRSIHDTGAEAVVLGDLGCMLNIEGRLRREGDEHTRVLHVAQILAGDA